MIPRIPPSRCTDKLRDSMFSDPLYVAEEKLDGARFMLYIEQDQTFFYSRRDFPRIDRALNVPHLATRYPGFEGTVLDGEAIRENATKLGDTSSIMLSSPQTARSLQEEHGCIEFHAFDILFYKGQDVRRKPLHERRQLLVEAIAFLGNRRILLVEQSEDKRGLFKAVTERGGEGVVLKNVNNGYGLGWAKWKKRFDVSCVVSGFKPGNGKYADQIGAIQLSVYKGPIRWEDCGVTTWLVSRLGYDNLSPVGKAVYDKSGSENMVEIGFASGMTDAERFEMSQTPDKFIGKVVDVFAQELTQDGRLRHPVFHRMRDDVNPTACTFEKVQKDLR